MACLLLLAGMLLVGGLEAVTVLQASAAAAALALALVLMRWKGWVEPAAWIIALALAVTPILQSFFDGGVRDPALALIVIAPIAASMTSGLRLALVSLAVSVCGAAGLLALDLSGYAFPEVSPPETLAWWSFIVATGAGCLSLLAGILYVRHTDAALDAAETLANDLTASLRESEARYRSLFEHIPLGVYRTAPDGTILLANPAAATMIGAASPADAVGRNVAQTYADPARRLDFQAAIKAAGEVRGFEVHCRAPDGIERWVRLDARAVHDASGALQYYEGVLKDITAEREAREAVRRSETRFRALVQCSSDVTAVIGREGRIAYASPAVEHLLGAPPEALVGTDVFALFHPDDVAAARTAFGALQMAPPRVTPASELRLRHRAGHYVVADGVGSARFDDPAVGGLVVNLRDATERRRAQMALVLAKRKAEEVAHLKSTFLANMSHEIRTPLTAILGFADVLSDEVTDPEQREFVDLIAQGGRRLMDTLNSVLELARLESGRGEMTLTPAPVAGAVDEAVRLMQPQARDRGLTLTGHIDAPHAIAAVDDGAFGRVLHNLIGNALKFTERGGVTVSLTTDDENVLVTVRDTGIGIDPAFLPRLFGEFEQASTGVERTHEGAGLGLSIARQLVERMGGTVKVESEVGVGTTFTVTLPMVAPEPFALPSPGAGGLPVALVVDDNEQALLVASRVLGDSYRLVTAEDARAALAAARLDPPAVAVLDIHLGAGANGADLMDHLRGLPGLANLPVVAVTAFGLPGDRARYIEAGFDEYVAKPYTRERLLQAIQAVRSRAAVRA